MTIPKKVLILVAIPHFDYSDKKSAVLSWMNQIKSAFEEKGAEVQFADAYEGKKSKSVSLQNRDPFFVRILKKTFKLWPWFYYSIVYRQYFKEQDRMCQLLLKNFDCDMIVEFHTVGSTVGVEIAKKCNARLSVIFDSPVEEQFEEMHGTKSIHWKRICDSEKISMEAANKIMVYSPACEEHLRSKYNITAEVNKLPSSLNKPIEGFTKIDTGTFNVGFIGSFLSWHKLDMLVRVFEDFHKKYDDARLILLGFGQEWKYIKELAEKSSARDAIDIPGFVSEEELLEYKRKFTIALMPGSNWYGSPLKLFEYARAGLPFIAPVSKTVSSIFVEGEHCLYVKEEDQPGSLFKALETYYKDPELRDRLGSSAKKMIEDNFNKKVYYEKLINNLS